jgi:hypothetical protein
VAVGAQSDGAVQVVRQLPVAALQVKGMQGVEGPFVQEFVASHFGMRQLVIPTHVLAPQTVPSGYLVQPPRPSHSPLVPQVDTGWVAQRSRGSSAPAGTGRQVPGMLATLHEWQAAVQVVAQQTPSTQIVLVHWEPVVQGPPVG